MKKLLCAALSALLLCSVFAFAASAETLTGSCGDNVNWSLDIDTGVMTVSGEGDMWDFVTSLVAEDRFLPTYFSNRTKIKSVIIEDGVTRIGNQSFGSTNTSNITIPASIKSIGTHAFQHCSDLLTEIVIPEGVERIEARAFSSNYFLTKVVLPDSLTYIHSTAFTDGSGKKAEAVFHCNPDSYAYNWVIENGFTLYDPNPAKWWESLSIFTQWFLRIFAFGWLWMK